MRTSTLKAKQFLLVMLVASSPASAAAASASVALTKGTFDELTAGKTVFIKFYAPWCGFCQELAPEWERMASEWVDHAQGFVGEVDCTADAAQEKWCRDDMKILGFPTLYWGDASHGGAFLEEYRGDEKTYEELSAFANATLGKPVCTVGNPGPCDDETKAKINSYSKLSAADIDKAILEKETAIGEAEFAFQREFKVLQKEYDAFATEHASYLASIKNTIRLLREIVGDAK